jgi:hypothetical protein
MNPVKISIVAAALICICGCSLYRAPTPVGDYYYLNPDADMSKVGKVVLVQLRNNSVYPQISTDVTRALYEEIQKKQLFSLRVIPEDDPEWRSLNLDIDSLSQPTQLFLAAKTLRCDAIMVGDITEYTPYPHLVLGLRLKMIRCNDCRLLWAFEQVWDAADKKTEYRIKKYLAKQTRTGTEVLGEQLVTVSSIKFVKFVAYEVALSF